MKLIIYRRGVEKVRELDVSAETIEYFVSRCCSPRSGNIIEIVDTHKTIHTIDHTDVVGYEVREQ